MKAGDLIVSRSANGSWSARKVLAVDDWPDGTQTYHCLCYEPTANKPTPDTLRQQPVAVYHAPIDASNFRHWEAIDWQPVTQGDLVGFAEYLKHTDF